MSITIQRPGTIDVTKNNPVGELFISGDNNTDGSKRQIFDNTREFVRIEFRESGFWVPDGFIFGPDSVVIGTNLSIGDFGEILAVTNIGTNETELLVEGLVTEAGGIVSPEIPTSLPSEIFLEITGNADVSVPFTEANPIEFVIDPTIFSSTLPSTEFLLLSNTVEFASVPPSKRIKTEIWIGTDDTGHKIFEGFFDIDVGLIALKPPNPQIFRTGKLYFSRSSPLGGSATVRGTNFPPFVARGKFEGYAIQRFTDIHQGNVDILVDRILTDDSIGHVISDNLGNVIIRSS